MSENLADIPQDWNMTYGADPQIFFVDYAVVKTAGKPSFRIERHVEGVDNNAAREVDGTWIPIKPGDKINASCFIKTSPSGLGDTNPFSGARFGLDFYGPNGRIAGLHGNYGFPDTDQAIREGYVAWNTPNWTLKTIAVTVPDKIVADGALAYSAGQLVTPTSFVMWLQVWSSSYGGSDPGLAWFADPVLTVTTMSEDILTNLDLRVNPTRQYVPFECYLSALLQTQAGGPLGGRTVRFTKDGLPFYYALTSVEGMAYYPGTIPFAVGGQTAFGAEFDGDGQYRNCSSAIIYVVALSPLPPPPVEPPPVEPPPVLPPPAIPSGAASVGGVEIGGYAKVLPPGLVRLLWKFRNKYISREVHRKLHPLI